MGGMLKRKQAKQLSPAQREGQIAAEKLLGWKVFAEYCVPLVSSTALVLPCVIV